MAVVAFAWLLHRFRILRFREIALWRSLEASKILSLYVLLSVCEHEIGCCDEQNNPI